MTELPGAISRYILTPGSLLYILGFSCIWLSFSAGFHPLFLPDEGRYVGIALEMLNNHDWSTPTLDGLPFFHKPPLFYWLVGLSMQVFGVNEWAARVPSMLVALLSVTALSLFVRKHDPKPGVANLTAVILITQPFFFLGAQFANMDMLVASMITLAILAGADAILDLQQNKPYRLSLTACYLFAALGVLAKGLIGLVLPGMVLLVWLLLHRQYRLIPRLVTLWGVGLFLLVAAPWFIAMQHAYPGFYHYFFVYQHFQRYLETGFNNQQAFWFYIPVLLILTLPWSPWLFRGISRPRLLEAVGGENGNLHSLMLLWVLGILLFFSLPKSKLVGYILPVLPALAYLLAGKILGWSDKAGNKRPGTVLGINILVAGSLCLAMIASVTFIYKSNLKEFQKASIEKPQAQDLVMMLDGYSYDLGFYLGTKNPAWVTGHWDDPSIPTKDDLRKELYDSGLFNPAKMSENLIQPDAVLGKLCALPQSTRTVWAWGGSPQGAYEFLAAAEMVPNKHGKPFWKLDVPTLQHTRFCEGMPKNGSAGTLSQR